MTITVEHRARAGSVMRRERPLVAVPCSNCGCTVTTASPRRDIVCPECRALLRATRRRVYYADRRGQGKNYRMVDPDDTWGDCPSFTHEEIEHMLEMGCIAAGVRFQRRDGVIFEAMNVKGELHLVKMRQ
jgi:hypothetical protein